MRVFRFPKLIALEDAKYDPREAKSRPRDAQERPKSRPREAQERQTEAQESAKRAPESKERTQQPIVSELELVRSRSSPCLVPLMLCKLVSERILYTKREEHLSKAHRGSAEWAGGL